MPVVVDQIKKFFTDRQPPYPTADILIKVFTAIAAEYPYGMVPWPHTSTILGTQLAAEYLEAFDKDLEYDALLLHQYPDAHVNERAVNEYHERMLRIRQQRKLRRRHLT